MPRSAFVGHVGHFGTSDLLEQLGRRVRRRADALRRKVDLAGIGLGIGDQLGHRLGRKILAHQNDVGNVRHDRNRHELRRIVVKRFVKQWIGRDRRRLRRQERVTIGRRMENIVGGDAAADAGPVLDHHRLAEKGLHLGGDQPGDGVDAPAGRYRDDDPDRMVGVASGAALCPRGRCCGAGSNDAEADDESVTSKHNEGSRNSALRWPHGIAQIDD